MEKESFVHLVPHAGRMLLIDRVLSWDDRSLRASSRTHLSRDHPLQRNDQLSVIHSLEYGAQAMALHGGLLAEKSGQPISNGYLASGRKLQFHCARLDDLDAELVIDVKQQHVQEGSLMYTFLVSAGELQVADGVAIVMTRPDDRTAAFD